MTAKERACLRPTLQEQPTVACREHCGGEHRRWSALPDRRMPQFHRSTNQRLARTTVPIPCAQAQSVHRPRNGGRIIAAALDETHDPPRAGDERHPIGHRALSEVRGVFCAILCALVCGCGGGGSSGNSPAPPPPPPPTNATLLAVTNATAGTIDILTTDPMTGVPTPIAGNPLPDGPTPSAVALDPQKRFLYVASSSGEIRGYLIDPSSLKLTAVTGSPFSTSAQSVAIAIDSSGQFVLTANGSANTVSVFKIGSSGALAEVAGSPFAAGANASAVVVAGHYVYVANTLGHSVSAYSMNTTSGALVPVGSSPFPTNGSPNGLVVDQTGTHVYTSESQPNELSGFSINASTGALTAIPGSPFAAGYTIRSPVMDAEGKRLHVANGTDVDCFLVNASSGALTEIGLSYTNGRALALALDGPDDFLYALDNVDNQIEVFSIDPTDGMLTLITGSPFALFPGASTQNLGPNAITVQH
jgi:6-phosphogluconolactonase (cycloisomerase 2 family)